MQKRIFIVCIVLACVFSAWLFAAFLGPWAFERFSIGAGIAVTSATAICLLTTFFRWLAAQDLFAPWIAFPIAYILWFSIGSFNLFNDPDPPPYGAIALGLACYLAGTWLGKAIWKPAGVASGVKEQWSPERFQSLIIALALISLLAYALIAVQMGIPGFGAVAAERRLDLIHYGKSQFIFLCGAWTVLIFLATRLWTRAPESSNSSKATLLAMAFIAALILSLGSRGNLFVPIVTIVIARHYLFRKTNLKWAISIGLLAFVAASYLGWARDAMGYGETSLGNLQFNGAGLFYLYFYVHNTVTTLRDVMATIPLSVPYQHGYLSFGALASILPGHHISSDMFFRQILGLNFLGFGQPATLLGPMYGDFGLAGIAVQMVALGAFCTWAHTWMLRKRTVFTVLMYAWLSQVAIYSIYGALLAYFTDVAIPIAWVLLHVFLRAQQPVKASYGEAPLAAGG